MLVSFFTAKKKKNANLLSSRQYIYRQAIVNQCTRWWTTKQDWYCSVYSYPHRDKLEVTPLECGNWDGHSVRCLTDLSNNCLKQSNKAEKKETKDDLL
ncbi:MAG: hypothetical protein K0B10_01320 [Vicingaceae bacterium]|nr:hypothetical protein [Vicingaceae bacterium]